MNIPTNFRLRPTHLHVWAVLSLVTPAAYAESNIEIDLPTVNVVETAYAVGSDPLVSPAAGLNGRELSLQRESTLGDTLNHLPGVSASGFGPNASRPVIRGLDNERVRLLQNGIGILDASSLSPDHAVSIDPLVIEQIDIVRGPAALLYGNSAVGGVVNAIDHRIPTEKLEGIIGRAEGRIGGPDSQNNLATVLDVGNGLLALHADVYSRKTSDLDIPGYAVSKRKFEADGTMRDNRDQLINSSAENDGGAIGAALTFENGYIGTAFSAFNSNYGTVAEPAVRIDMQSQRWDVASEFTGLSAMIPRIKFKLAHTDYTHQELEDGEVGTTFKNRGTEGLIEAAHGKIGPLTGLIGFQVQNSDFAALGDEAFVPTTHTNAKSLYIYETLPLDRLQLEFSSRLTRANVDSQGGGAFGPAQQKQFTPSSYAAGATFDLDEQWSIAGQLSHNERAPSYFELYANGAHIATGQFEVGNADFNVERSHGIDAKLSWKNVKHRLSVGTYYTRFDNFIGLINTGNDINVGGDIFPEARFTMLKARFTGLEADGKFSLNDDWSLNIRGDYVRATNVENGDPLPRINPLRLGAGLHYQKANLGARLDILHAFKQDRTGANELATDAYTDLSAMLTYKLPTKLNIELFAKANNLLDDEIREHASFLKDIAPQGARALLIGFRSDF